jgi:exosortase A
MAVLWPVLRPVWPALALGLLLLAALFHAEGQAAVHVWNTSTAYGHCWLILPLALWLVWDRRFDAAAQTAAPLAWVAVLGVPLAAAWLVADLLGIMEGRQLAAVGFIEVLLLAVLGARLWWAVAAGVLYIVFLVPFGAFLTPALQGITAGFVAHGMEWLGIPGRVTAYQIQIPEGNFYVAEACAGLRFLIASVAFGTLYAMMMFRSPVRRTAFIAVSVLIPIVANGIRALGIVVLGHVLGSAQAAATDHVLYGWMFFSIVILLLAAAGMPFRQDPPASGPAVPPAVGVTMPALLAMALVVALAVCAPLAAAWIGSSAAAPDAGPVFVVPEGCAITGVHPAGPVLTESLLCGDAQVTARLQILPHRANPARVMDAGLGQTIMLLGGGDLDGSQLDVPAATPRYWTMQRDRETARAGAAALFIDGTTGQGGLHDRIRLMRDLLTGSGHPPVAVAVAVTGGAGDPEVVLRRFLAAQGDLAGRVFRLAL